MQTSLPPISEIWVYLSGSPLLALVLTLSAYWLGLTVYERTQRNPLANPVLIAVVLVTVIIGLLDMPYAKYFEGLMKLQIKLFELGKVSESKRLSTLGDRLVFSTNGTAAITARAIGYHFDKIMTLAEVSSKDRDLVPYSFRHYFITKRVNSNLPIASIAEMCGTSITQIEKTYYHTTEDKMVSNALADYEYKDGMLIPK